MKLRREQGGHGALLPAPAAGRAGTVRRVLRGGTCFWYSVVGVLLACQLVAAYIYFFSAPSLHPVKSPPDVPPPVLAPSKAPLARSLHVPYVSCGAHATTARHAAQGALANADSSGTARPGGGALGGRCIGAGAAGGRRRSDASAHTIRHTMFVLWPD